MIDKMISNEVINILQRDDVQAMEREIVNLYSDFSSKDSNIQLILQERKRLINREILKHQEELLPHIIAFNDALTEALRKMLDQAHYMWESNTSHKMSTERTMSFTAKCYFEDDYPPLHPVQSNDRQILWAALCDIGVNPLYGIGLSLSPLWFPRDLDMAFDSLIGMDCPPPNWNEGLDPMLTKDLHLTSAFHNVFDHMCFAITDFIFVRDFYPEFHIELHNTSGNDR